MFKEVQIETQDVTLKGHISYENNSKAWVIFAHGSGSSRMSPRNNWVAKELNKEGFATFLFDLLTPEEDLVFENRFDISLIGSRLLTATNWLVKSSFYQNQPLAYFGASTGAAAALVACANAHETFPLYTVISRGGRPDLAGKDALTRVHVPVLLIVGSLDYEVIRLNEMAQNELANCKLSLVQGATHLFEESGTLGEVVKFVISWLEQQLPKERAESYL